MSPVQAMDLCRANDALSEKDIWAFAEQLRENGDHGLIGFMMETNEARFAAKVGKAAGAKAERHFQRERQGGERSGTGVRERGQGVGRQARSVHERGEGRRSESVVENRA